MLRRFHHRLLLQLRLPCGLRQLRWLVLSRKGRWCGHHRHRLHRRRGERRGVHAVRYRPNRTHHVRLGNEPRMLQAVAQHLFAQERVLHLHTKANQLGFARVSLLPMLLLLLRLLRLRLRQHLRLHRAAAAATGVGTGGCDGVGTGAGPDTSSLELRWPPWALQQPVALRLYARTRSMRARDARRCPHDRSRTPAPRAPRSALLLRDASPGLSKVIGGAGGGGRAAARSCAPRAASALPRPCQGLPAHRTVPARLPARSTPSPPFLPPRPRAGAPVRAPPTRPVAGGRVGKEPDRRNGQRLRRPAVRDPGTRTPRVSAGQGTNYSNPKFHRNSA